jgi:uncharacterized protein (TIGR02246 family)
MTVKRAEVESSTYFLRTSAFICGILGDVFPATIYFEEKSMKRLACFCVISALAVMMLGCNSGSANHDADVASLKANEVQWNADWASHNMDKIVGHYTDDAVLMVAGEPASKGVAEIRKNFKDMVVDPATVLKFSASRVEVSDDGTMGVTQGSYTLAAMDPQTKKVENDHGSYVTMYRKQADGSWKSQLDIAVSEVPMPMTAPAADSH